MSESNAELTRRFVEELINQGRFELIEEIVHEDYVYRSPGGDLQGRDQVIAMLSGHRAAFPDLRVSIDDIIASGDRVAAAVTLTGTQKGELMGIPPTGKKVRVEAMIFSRVRDGKIVEDHEVLDTFSMMQQLGVFDPE